jgi:hypothetical protein
MEPNKNTEHQFKDKLNARQIQPSAAAWDRLDAMLSVAEQKKPQRRFNFLSIAAGFAGIVFAVVLVYQIKLNQVTSDATVAIVPNKVNNVSQNNGFVMSNSVKVQTAATSKQERVVLSKKKFILNQKDAVANSQIKNQNAVVAQNEANDNQNATEIATQQLKVNAELLLTAVETSEPKQIKPVVLIAVDANSLLSEVNGELRQEFRETKFQRLKRNFQSAKVAVNARNNK